MKRSRMDIQSDNDYKIYNSKGYFVAYLSQKWVPKDKPAHGRIFCGTQGFAISVLKEYTNESYIKINEYLRNGNYHIQWGKNPLSMKITNNSNGSITISASVSNEAQYNYNYFLNMYEKISSLACALTGLNPNKIEELDDIPRYTTVYRGVRKRPPYNWKVGDEFYFPEFISTSLKEDIAKDFGDYIFVIKLNGNAYKGVEKLSYYPYEKEVLICAYSRYKITNIYGNYYYMDQFDS